MSGGFLDRWSRRKLASAAKALLADAPAPGMPPAAESGGQGELVPSGARPAHAPDAGAEAAVPSAVEAQLPAVEGLTLASDFTGFLKEEVSEALRRQALHKLFADPHFNRMDGLDIYIDDYSLPDPIPPEAMAKLKSAREWLMANEAEVEAEAADAGRAEATGGDTAGDTAAAAADAAAVGAEPGPEQGARAAAADAASARSGAGPQGATTRADDEGARTIGPSALPALPALIESGQKAP